MGVELVDDEEELPLPGVPLEPADGAPEDPRGEPVGLGLPALHVREAEAQAVADAAIGQVAGQIGGVLDLPRQGDPVPIRLLPPDPLPRAEAPVVVHRGLEHVERGDEQRRLVPVVAEDLGHRHLLLRDRLPPRDQDGVPLVEPVAPAGEGPHPGVHRPPHRQCGQRLRVGVQEPHALPSQGVDVRGLDPVVPVGPDVVPPQAVEHDQDDVCQRNTSTKLDCDRF